MSGHRICFRKKASITAGKKYVFKVVKQGIAEKVQWTVSNKKLASINAKGKLSAKQFLILRLERADYI